MSIRCIYCGKEVASTSLQCCGVQYALNGSYTISTPKKSLPQLPLPVRAAEQTQQEKH